MKVSKFSDSQIASILKQAESGVPVPALCREHGISSATFYKWRSKYAACTPSKRLSCTGWREAVIEIDGLGMAEE